MRSWRYRKHCATDSLWARYMGFKYYSSRYSMKNCNDYINYVLYFDR